MPLADRDMHALDRHPADLMNQIRDAFDESSFLLIAPSFADVDLHERYEQPPDARLTIRARLMHNLPETEAPAQCPALAA